jgi:hypothetical protein
MIRIVYETGEEWTESKHVVAYDETTDYWVLAPEGEESDLRRRIPGHRVYFVESDDPSHISTW